MVYTRPAVLPQIGAPETVTTAFQLSAIAFMIPAYTAVAVLLAWLWLKSARSRHALGPAVQFKTPTGGPQDQPPATG